MTKPPRPTPPGCSEPPTLLQEIAWFLRDYAETLDPTPHPRLDGLRRSVDAALQEEVGKK
jgi:hypothetical protein